VAFALLNGAENNMLSEPEKELVYDTLAKDQDERMAQAL